MSHLFAFFLLVGCGDSQQSTIEKIPLAPDGVELHADDSSTDHASVETSADGSAWTKIVDMRFDIPKEWKKVQLTGMQASILAAKYVLANYSPDLELTVSRVGGGLESNLRRWEGQFTGGRARRHSFTVNGHDVQVIELDGEFNSGTVQEERLDWGMIGIGIQDNQQDVYLKLLGPREDVAAARTEFLDFVKRIRP